MSCAPTPAGTWPDSPRSSTSSARGRPSPSTPGTPMSSRSERADAALLRRWGLPDPGDSEKTRGRVMVVGGSRRAPGAVLLAGEAALRVGAGRLGLVVPGSIDAQIGIAIPEAAIFALPERATAAIGQPARDELSGADAVLVGPGFDDPEQTRGTVLAVADCGIGCLVLD